ncbi:uncharacterized protein Z518_09915 [Rhinocladiella mackenziei CBS 650.93]|uniref:SET domain-containing protein n=1 Tax=Rhinocladiella mackenziei CBS 650.93 TaxID=1442369 RepID=A0A0D2IVX7_9EURO|nr:uncharacterized protein Z518_09915 [Rhinocladiella mackenziei CBS 650.93]KIX00850.1 hypothetical protein Z518_09915 [Rhinocladiella mackenziei CBS 650.93]
MKKERGKAKSKRHELAATGPHQGKALIISKFKGHLLNRPASTPTATVITGMNPSLNGSNAGTTPESEERIDLEAQPDLKPQDYFLKVSSTPDRGLAVFATRKIKAGTLILAEKPLISLDKDKENDYSAIEREFSSLSRADQKAYLKLFDAQKSRMSRVVSIYYSNCYNCDGFKNDGQGGSAIGAIVSRINHSCVPNVQFSYDGATDEIKFHAIRDMSRGKEVCSNYDKSVFEVTSKRQGKQQMHYGFVCQCEACEPKNEFWAKSDERRKGMYKALRVVQGCEKRYSETRAHVGAGEKNDDGVDDALNALVKLERLLLKECLVGVPLANTYRSMAKWAERKGDLQGATKWKIKEMEVCIIGFGKEAARTKAIDAKLKELRSASS